MNTTKLGELINSEQPRDAIHIAIAPVVSDILLKPGDKIALVENSLTKVSKNGKHIGIVDPFLEKQIEPGEWFWMLLFPQTITSLKHEWTHPSFLDNSMSESEKWIREFADSVGLGYQTLLDGADNWIKYEEYLCFGGLLEGYAVPDEFWTHYENITKQKIEESKKDSFFTCSC
mgnify:CR=1 FL=1